LRDIQRVMTATIVVQRWASAAPRCSPARDWRGQRPSNGAKGANIRAHVLITVRDYGPSEGPLLVFADGRRRREPGLTGDKAPRRLSRDCRVDVISAEAPPARRRLSIDG
jgi:hypothetical protein